MVIAEKEIWGALFKCSCRVFFTFLLNGVSTYFSQLGSDLCEAPEVEVPMRIWMDSDVGPLSFSEVTVIQNILFFFFFSKNGADAMPPL